MARVEQCHRGLQAEYRQFVREGKGGYLGLSSVPTDLTKYFSMAFS